MPSNFLPKVYFQGRFVDFEEAKISIANSTFQYGTGVFGGLRGCFDKAKKQVVLFRVSDHSKRLSQSASFLDFQLEVDFIQNKILEFVELNKPENNFYIRPMVYISELGIAPKIHSYSKDFLIYGLQLEDYLDPDGVSLGFSSWFKISDNSIPTRAKFAGSYVNSALAKTEAIERGFDDCLMLNSQGQITEASAMNFFLVRAGELITPGVESDILEGITRKTVIEIAKDLGLKVVLRPISKTEIYLAQEAFLTGTAAKITPIKTVEGFDLPTNRPITRRLQKLYQQITTGQENNYQHWLTKISL